MPHGVHHAPVAEREILDVIEDLFDSNPHGIGNLTELGRRMADLAGRQNPESWRRTIRRWRKVNPKERDIAFVAKAFGVSRDVLPPAKARPALADVERRLAELEATVGHVGGTETVAHLLGELQAQVADAIERILQLEARSGHDGVAGAGSP